MTGTLKDIIMGVKREQPVYTEYKKSIANLGGLVEREPGLREQWERGDLVYEDEDVY